MIGAPGLAQSNAWTEPSWLQVQTRWDEILEPCTEVLVQRADLRLGQRVVDVGCGTGALTRATARICGRALGLDISRPLLEHARVLAADARLDVDFVEADAARWVPGTAIDRVVSRFGIAFFDDPIAAFTNLRRWLAPGGTMTALSGNALTKHFGMSGVVKVIEAHSSLPAFDAAARGPASLADPDRVCDLLRGAGFDRVQIDEIEIATRVEGDRACVLDFYRRWGPSAHVYRAAPPEIQSHLTRGFEEYIAAGHDGAGLAISGHVLAIHAQ